MDKSVEWYEKQIKGLIMLLDANKKSTFIARHYIKEKLLMMLVYGVNFHPHIIKAIGIEPFMTDEELLEGKNDV